MDKTALILFVISAIVIVGIGMIFSWIVAPKSKNAVKEEPYECGIPTKGTSFIQFRVGYYLFVIIFLIFDVEIIFFYPWAVNFRSMGFYGFWVMAIFFVVLVLGLAYDWKKGALEWE